MGVAERHFAFIGMAHVADNYPLYYDAVNEKGLGIAGLNFVGNAHYGECREGKDNIAQWELIPLDHGSVRIGERGKGSACPDKPHRRAVCSESAQRRSCTGSFRTKAARSRSKA